MEIFINNPPAELLYDNRNTYNFYYIKKISLTVIYIDLKISLQNSTSEIVQPYLV